MGHPADKRHPVELLTTSEMAEADRLAIAAGISGLSLMENAGRAVADMAENLLGQTSPGKIAILCGPGNNGGDGFVAARLLQQRGHRVGVALLGEKPKLRGDAAAMAERWQDSIAKPELINLDDQDLVIDALFGAGLSRPPDGEAAELIDRINASPANILAVDVPSGLDGTTGNATGTVVKADATITFFRFKPGHLLMPGRQLCGLVHLADIAIPPTVLDEITPDTFRNSPELWESAWLPRSLDEHKYSRGHAVVLSGPVHATGAARLAAGGALHIGAGLVTVASPADAVTTNAAHLTAIMIAPLTDDHDIADVLADERKNAVLIGPGAGVGETTRNRALQALASPAAVVLDADALTSFADDNEQLFDAYRGRNAGYPAPPAQIRTCPLRHPAPPLG